MSEFTTWLEPARYIDRPKDFLRLKAICPFSSSYCNIPLMNKRMMVGSKQITYTIDITFNISTADLFLLFLRSSDANNVGLDKIFVDQMLIEIIEVSETKRIELSTKTRNLNNAIELFKVR